MLDMLTVTNEEFAADVLEGLGLPQKMLPCRWLYDERGSQLFEEITDLPEYYPTRTETKILEACRGEIAAAAGRGATLVEYGSGASVKTRLLLDTFEALHCYVPIDVSATFLEDTADQLRRDYPSLSIKSVVGDFLSPIAVPMDARGNGRTVGFFPGSTIGNLSNTEISDFFRRARQDLGGGASFVLGADLKKDVGRLIPAYDDAAGVTAAFNLNILKRINRELAGTFALDQFAHEARWNEDASRVEMHLVSQMDQTVSVGGAMIGFAEGETIHTENSRKFALDELVQLAEAQGWTLSRSWMDDEKLFSVVMLDAA
ncbi:L-histidine N(alpha)-methyltransferase [Parvibaculaceae bacterium PLY_AMNH_Bact1]|nr:L-histidine N(alpha)-methyltransferase [Parvibaculaceae bacterium PLY_AMNH_Bact1]